MTPEAASRFVYLASQSPRRGQLLTQIGVRFEPLLPRADEDAEALEAERSGELPAAYAERVTRAKLHAARARLLLSGLPVAPILCADTVVALGRRILGKPVDAADATATLRLLSGRTHRVITAVAIGISTGNSRGRSTGSSSGAAADGGIHNDACDHVALCITRVRFAVLPEPVIAAYVASGEPFGKAGAYAIQSSFAAWIERIDGSYSGVMGLPLFETARLLEQLGWHV